MRIGVDLGGTKIEGAALDRAGRIAVRRRMPTPPGYDATVAAVSDLACGLEAEVGEVCSVGVGMPGAISPATGLVKNANSTWLNGRQFDRDVATALGREVRFANDANCFALSEAIDGAGREARSVFGAILGTGVGGGVVLERRLVVGANAIAGEWGHLPLPWPTDDERPGPPCYCGRRGCVETFLSGPALARDAGAADAAGVAQHAATGSAAAEAALARYEERLARALALVIDLVDPDAIVLGGGLGQMARLYENVPRIWGRYIFSDAVATRLLAPVWGDSSGVRGAAWLWEEDPALSTKASTRARSRRGAP